MLPDDAQLAIEHKYSRKKIDGYIRKEIEDSPEIMSAISKGVELLDSWLNKTYYESKQLRLDEIKPMNLHELIFDIVVSISYHYDGSIYTNVAAQAATRLHMSDTGPAIHTMSEIIALLSELDLWDIYRQGPNNSIYLKSRIRFENQLMEFIANSSYLPPMVCKPQKVTSNYSSAYMTFDESVILNNKHHEDPVSLDTINIQNNIALSINTDFLYSIDEIPTKEITSLETQKAWDKKLSDSRDFYALMLQQGNKFY